MLPDWVPRCFRRRLRVWAMSGRYPRSAWDGPSRSTGQGSKPWPGKEALRHVFGNSGGHQNIIKAGGWMGLATAVAAWYASFAAVTNSTFGRTVLPVMPLKD